METQRSEVGPASGHFGQGWASEEEHSSKAEQRCKTTGDGAGLAKREW